MKIDLKIEVEGRLIRVYSYHSISDPQDDNIDIFVDTGGDVYGGTIYTVENTRTLMNKPGMPFYFHDRHGVVVEALDNETLEKAFRELILENDIERIFCRQIA